MARQFDYDRDWLNELIDTEIRNQPGAPIGTIIAAAVAREIERFAEQGDEQAPLAIRAALESWVIQKVEMRLRSEQLRIPVSWNGAELAVAVPARLGHRVKVTNPEGRAVKAIQYPLWTYQPWDVVEQLRASKVAVRDGSDQQIAAFDRALRLRERYPEETPHRAAELEGLDPLTFKEIAQ